MHHVYLYQGKASAYNCFYKTYNFRLTSIMFTIYNYIIKCITSSTQCLKQNSVNILPKNQINIPTI